MTETPEVTEPSGPRMVACAHCEVESLVDTGETPDWLCSNCGRYQNSVVCPTCHSVVSRSQLEEAAA
jgi:hypothetical protein